MARKQLDLDFFGPAFMEDPTPLYEQIRAVGNVVWNDLLVGWTVVGYEEAVSVSLDPGERFVVLISDLELVPWFEAPNMITVDGAEHRRLRGALAPWFTRSAVAKWERRVNDVVADMLAPLASSGDTFDLIADFTKLPTIIVSEMLGVPRERHEDFRRWSHVIVTNLAFGHEEPARRAAMIEAADELNEYLREELERHRRERPDDFLTAMLDLTGEEDLMTDAEIRSTAFLLLVAGYDTTAKTMSNCLIALERHPEQRREVASDPSLLPGAIEECLRWFGPVQWLTRVAVHDTVLGDAAVKAGDRLYVLLAAANRDPRRWEQPDRFDIHRELKSNLAFAYGPHLCLGAPLARLETKVALAALLRIAPEYHLRDIDFGNSRFVRGPERGVIDIGARAAVAQ